MIGIGGGVWLGRPWSGAGGGQLTGTGDRDR